MRLPAILLAAGASRRLGQPKQLVEASGETLLARSLRAAKDTGAAAIFVVLGANAGLIREAVDLSGASVVLNPDWDSGIAGSIRAGIGAVENAFPAAEAAMLLVCDQPLLTAQHLLALLAAFQESDGLAIVASEYAGIAGIPAIFPASEFSALRALKGDAGARYLLRNPSGPLIRVPFVGGELDIDTPEDLAAL